MGKHRIGLRAIIILSEGHKMDIFCVEQNADIFQIHAQGIIGGQRNDQRPIVAQMCLGSHQNRRVGNTVCQFGEGISGARGNEQNIEQGFRTDGLCVGNGGDGFFSGDASGFFQKFRSRSKTAVSVIGIV